MLSMIALHFFSIQTLKLKVPVHYPRNGKHCRQTKQNLLTGDSLPAVITSSSRSSSSSSCSWCPSSLSRSALSSSSASSSMVRVKECSWGSMSRESWLSEIWRQTTASRQTVQTRRVGPRQQCHRVTYNQGIHDYYYTIFSITEKCNVFSWEENLIWIVNFIRKMLLYCYYKNVFETNLQFCHQYRKWTKNNNATD